ncbi:MAG: hypothetical protein ACLQDV_28695 [Candidatus Binataceae bacterium]
MRSIRHPLSGALYDLEAKGAIRVTGHDGRTGLFRVDGTYIDGDLYFADPHLCGWIGGRDASPRYREVGTDREKT